MPERTALILAEHLGKLHPVENVLVLFLAFGPLALLAVTIRIARARNAAESARESEDLPG